MNGDEEVVNTQQEQTEEQKPQRKPLSQHVEEFRDTVNDAGKTIETVGKAEEKVGNWLDGGEKAEKVASDVGSAASSAADASNKAMKASGKAKETAGKAKEAIGKTEETAGKIEEAAGKGAEIAGKTGEAAGKGLQATPYTAAAGKVVEGVSKVEEAAGKGAQVSGKTKQVKGKVDQAEGKVEQVVGKAEQAEGKAKQAAADATSAAAKTGKATTEAAKKAKDKSLADKLRERGKLNQARGKRLQETAKKFDSDEYFDNVFDKLGKGGKVLKGIIKSFDPRVIGVISLLIVTIGTLFVSYILSPLLYMSIINDTIGNPDNIEKINNYMAGLGFQNSEDAFYEEVDYLNIRYGKQLDFPYIMATLYYTDIFYGDTGFYSDDNQLLCGDGDKELCSGLQIAYQLAKYYLKESQTTTGKDGLVYSASKLYRLRALAKSQFLGATTPKSASLDEYIEMCIEKMDNETKQVVQYFPFLILYAITRIDPVAATIYDALIMNTEIGKIVFDLVGIFTGTESWDSVMLYAKNGKYDSGFFSALKNFADTFLNCFFHIKGIHFKVSYDDEGNPDYESSFGSKDETGIGSLFDNIGSLIIVDYYEYTFSEEKYETYLVDTYIRKMPEFSKLLKDNEGNPLTGTELDDRVNQIGYEIRQVKDIFDKLYELNAPAQQYGNCIGDINLDLLSELDTPVKLSIGQVITFDEETNYGLIKGIMHNGVDLQENTTNTKAGDEVYSIYTGTVYESTADGTYSDSTAKGGWLVIDYDVQYSDSSYGNGPISKMFKNKKSSIKIFYGGLKPDSVKLKKGDVVGKGDVIGVVGDASASENGNTPSLHFGFYDTKLNLFLNPVNMFITCKKKKGSGASSCSNGGTTIELPDSVLEWRQENYTVTFYNENGFITGNCPNGCAAYDAAKVRDMWLEDGARFIGNIGVINIDGQDRYMAAVTEKFAKTGDLAYANLENGETIPLIIADVKDYKDTGAENNGELCDSENATDPGCYGHIDGSLLSVIEFEFDYDEYLSTGGINPASYSQEWDTSQQVISISNCGSALSD